MGEIDSGLESREALETVGKLRQHRNTISVVFFLLWLLNFILPFQHKQSGGTYTRLFGGITTDPITHVYRSGFQEHYAIWLSMFFVVTLILIVLAKRRLMMIFAVICSVLNLISLPIIYFGLTFSLTFFGPPEQRTPGFGFYTLCFIDLALIVFAFVLTRQFPKQERIQASEELLDF